MTEQRDSVARESADAYSGASSVEYDDEQEHEHDCARSVSYTHLRAHETVLDLVCRLLLEKKKTNDKRV